MLTLRIVLEELYPGSGQRKGVRRDSFDQCLGEGMPGQDEMAFPKRPSDGNHLIGLFHLGPPRRQSVPRGSDIASALAGEGSSSGSGNGLADGGDDLGGQALELA